MTTILHLATLLCLVILGHVQGQFISCHSCHKFTNVTECDLQPPETCTAEAPYCIIIQEVTGIPTVNTYDKVVTTKRCARGATCRGEDPSMWGSEKKIWCCETDLCNIFDNVNKMGFVSFYSHAQKSHPVPVIYTIALAIYLVYCAYRYP